MSPTFINSSVMSPGMHRDRRLAGRQKCSMFGRYGSFSGVGEGGWDLQLPGPQHLKEGYPGHHHDDQVHLGHIP